MKKNYEDEVIFKTRNFIFSFVDILIIYAMILIFNQFVNGNFDFIILLMTESISLLIFIILSVYIYLNIHNVRYNNKITNEIKKNGIKLQGKIIEIKKYSNKAITHTYFKRSYYYHKSKYTLNPGTTIGESENVIFYHAIVEYVYKGKKVTAISPSLYFDPNYIISKEVDVYLYDNKYYIDNYKIDKLKPNKYNKNN